MRIRRAPLNRARERVTKRSTGFPPKVRALVADRAAGVCEKCGCAVATQLHHRRPKAIGGSRLADTNSSENAIACCEPCHSEIHAKPDWSKVHGWLVRQGQSPAAIPVLLHHGWAVLDDAGRFHHLPEDAS